MTSAARAGSADISSRVLVAVGGNATHPENITGTTEEQEVVAAGAARALLPLMQLPCELIVTVRLHRTRDRFRVVQGRWPV